MVHDSVLDSIYSDSDSDYDDVGNDDEEENNELQSGFKAMGIATAIPIPEDPNPNPAESNPDLGESPPEPASEKSVEPLSNTQKKKKRKKKRKGNPGNPNNQIPHDRRRQPVSLEHFVVQTCRRIDEPKYPLFREAVERIGMDAMKSLLNQVDAIENCGGQMTADGARRRSAGGVLWSLLRDHVGPGLYKEIMKEGNRKHLEQQKAKLKEKGNGKRGHEEGNNDDNEEGSGKQAIKRRRTSVGVDVDGPVQRASLREEADSVRALAGLQNAWVQGLKRNSERGAPLVNPKPLNPKPLIPKPFPGQNLNVTAAKKPVSERLRMTVSYGDLVEEGTDSPIRGVEKGDCRAQFSEEVEEKEEGEIEEDGEIAG